MTRSPRAWRIASWFSAFGAVLIAAVCCTSHFVELFRLTSRSIDTIEAMPPAQKATIKALSPTLRCARIDYLVWGCVVLDSYTFVQNGPLPSTDYRQASGFRNRITPAIFIPSRLSDGSLLIPIWPLAVALTLTASFLWYFSPTKRSARAMSVWAGRRFPAGLRTAAAILTFVILFVGVPIPIVAMLYYGFRVDIDDMPEYERLALFFVILAWVGTSVLGAVVVHKSLRWRRAPVDRCLVCAYNLRGNESGVCPECGNPIHPRQAEWLAAHSGSATSSPRPAV